MDILSCRGRRPGDGENIATEDTKEYGYSGGAVECVCRNNLTNVAIESNLEIRL